MIALATGIATVAFLPQLPSWQSALFVSLLLVALHAWRRVTLVLLSALFCAGLAWGAWYGQQVVGALLPDAAERETLVLEGRVVGIPQVSQEREQRRQRFDLKVDRVVCPDEVGECPSGIRKVRLSRYGGEPVAPGQRWRFGVRLRRPRGFANPAGFDYGRWLVANGYHATGYVLNKVLPTRLESAFDPSTGWRYRLRQ